jgi:hypothetical protein
MSIRTLKILVAGALLATAAGAQSRTSEIQPGADPRGRPELTICNQNLENYGRFSDVRGRNPSLTMDEFKEKETALVRRFVRQRCDIIAVEEVIGKDEIVARKALQGLADKIRESNNRFFDVVVGPTNDPRLRVGFLVAKDRAEIQNKVSYVKTELPRISEQQKPRLFARGPLEVQVRVRGQDGTFDKLVSIVAFHFKSKVGAVGDPVALEYETYRMEMAEGLRRIVENRHEQSFGTGETILVLLGDRNSNFDAASAKILEGLLTLRQFQSDGSCRLSKRGVPLCKAASAINQRLFSVLTGDPETKQQPGTFAYKGVYSWLDDILMPAESLRYAWKEYDSDGNYSSGVVYAPAEASDHAMPWVTLNW